MGPTQDFQVRLIAEVGDPNNTIAALIPLLWKAYQRASAADLELLYLFVKRGLLDARLAEEVESTDITVGGDVTDAQGDRTAHLSAMRDATSAEIVRILAVRSGGRSASGALVKTQLESPPSANTPDALDDRYSGSPYRPRHLSW